MTDADNTVFSEEKPQKGPQVGVFMSFSNFSKAWNTSFVTELFILALLWTANIETLSELH